LPDADGFVLKGCELPAGEANNGAADGPAAIEAIVTFLGAGFLAADFFAVDFLAVDFLAFDFLLVFRLDAFAIINSSAMRIQNSIVPKIHA
jgi:hypothetical protein